jgi:hypothetical protein
VGEGEGEGEGEGPEIGPGPSSPPQPDKAKSAAKAEIANRLRNERCSIASVVSCRRARVHLAEFIFTILLNAGCPA